VTRPLTFSPQNHRENAIEYELSTIFHSGVPSPEEIQRQTDRQTDRMQYVMRSPSGTAAWKTRTNWIDSGISWWFWCRRRLRDTFGNNTAHYTATV